MRDLENQRAAFEAWITQPPYNRRVDVLSERSMSPDQYRYYEVQLAWDAWQEAIKSPVVKVQVPREKLIRWCEEWLPENDPKDGADCVTPFDEYLY